ncbi:MAG: NAD-dependent epimerase/dehydratase family protein, partial [Nitrospirales bacterium]|nr:NAD-dependent epimerase/dehydratase family protein [Nitrospirales bacterium]
MKALVTGATGFIGAAVTRALLHSGIDVRVLVRPTSNLKNLEGLKVESAIGDLQDPSSLRQALSGCHQLYHVAAHYALWDQDSSVFYRVNVEGTRRLLQTAAEVGIDRMVYTSTIGAIGLPEGGGLGTEETPLAPTQLAGDYKRSKYLAEQEVLKLAKAGIPVIIVNPTAPVGERDVKPTPTGQIIVDFMLGRMW